MTTTTFDPFGSEILADPYPEFARFVAAAPVFRSDELGYWVVSRYADCRRVLRDYRTFSASNSLAPITPPCARAGQALADGRVPVHSDAHQRRSAGPHPHPADRLPRVHPAPGGAAGGFRPRAGPPVPGRAAARRPGRHRVRTDLGAARPGDLRGARRATRGRRLGEGGLGQPAAVHVRPRGRGPAGGHRRPEWPRSGATARHWPRTGGPTRATTSPPIWSTPRTGTVSRCPSRRCPPSCSDCCWPATRPRRTCSATRCAGCSSTGTAGRRCARIRRSSRARSRRCSATTPR